MTPHPGVLEEGQWFGCLEPERPNDYGEKWVEGCEKCILKMELVFKVIGNIELRRTNPMRETDFLPLKEALAEISQHRLKRVG